MFYLRNFKIAASKLRLHKQVVCSPRAFLSRAPGFTSKFWFVWHAMPCHVLRLVLFWFVSALFCLVIPISIFVWHAMPCHVLRLVLFWFVSALFCLVISISIFVWHAIPC